MTSGKLAIVPEHDRKNPSNVNLVSQLIYRAPQLVVAWFCLIVSPCCVENPLHAFEHPVSRKENRPVTSRSTLGELITAGSAPSQPRPVAFSPPGMALRRPLWINVIVSVGRRLRGLYQLEMLTPRRSNSHKPRSVFGGPSVTTISGSIPCTRRIRGTSTSGSWFRSSSRGSHRSFYGELHAGAAQMLQLVRHLGVAGYRAASISSSGSSTYDDRL